MQLMRAATIETKVREGWLARMAAQARFARELCHWHPDRAAAWSKAIDNAEACVAKALDAGSGDLARAVAEAERLMAEIGAVAKTYTVHAVGHAHIDMNWQWSWSETVGITVDTFTTVLRLMEQYPEFCFSQSQASVYEILETYRPDLLKQVAKRVKEGRWEVTASHWVECDKNMAGPESLCRHLLYTRRYMQRLFRLSAGDVTIDWAPDTFGHAATVPTYLAKGGVRYVYLHRPGTQTQPKRWMFWWEGPDGARVLVRNDSKARRAYVGLLNPGVSEELALFTHETGLKDFMFVYGVGDHGGGPTRADLEYALEMDRWPVYPNIRFTTARRYFDLVAPQADRLPVLRGELNFEFAGCYTTQSLIKRANRYGENRLLDAETASALAWLRQGHAYPAERFREAWQHVLFNHFHDILPGSGVMDTRTYSHGMYQRTLATSAQAEMQTLRLLAAEVNTAAAGQSKPALPIHPRRDSIGAGVGRGTHEGGFSAADQTAGRGDVPIVLFNPTATDREEVVQATVWDTNWSGDDKIWSRTHAVTDPDGKALPTQLVDSGGYWWHDFVVLAFPVRVPAMGYAVYTVRDPVEGAAPAAAGPEAWHIGSTHHCNYAAVERNAEGIENAFLRVELDPIAGGIRRLTDKRSGLDLIDQHGLAPALEYEVERPHGMSSWVIQHAGAPAEAPLLKNLRHTRSGPWEAAIEAVLEIRESRFSVTYALKARDPRLYVTVTSTWFQRGTPETGIPVLNFRVPLALEDARGRYEIPFGAVDRDMNRREEVPSQQWAQVVGRSGGKAAGLLLLNDCKYGHSLEGSTLRLSLIRSAYEPDLLPEIGQHEIRMALVPFSGDLPVSQAIREGQAFNRPLRAVGTDIHQGPLPLAGQFVKLAEGPAVLCALKRAEEADALVVRLFNPTGESTKAKIEFGRELGARPVSAAEVDLMEQPARQSSARVAGSTVTVGVPAFGIASVRIEMSAAARLRLGARRKA